MKKLDPQVKELRKVIKSNEKTIKALAWKIQQLEADIINLERQRGLLRMAFYEMFLKDSYFFASITPLWQKVLKLRFGFDDGVPRTLEEVGIEIGVTRERVRQIECKAIELMKIFGKF